MSMSWIPDLNLKTFFLTSTKRRTLEKNELFLRLNIKALKHAIEGINIKWVYNKNECP